MSSPKVFISYSHDSEPHKKWVINLATELQKNGVETILDQWDLRPGQDIATFMQRSITDANRVIIICSNDYVFKSEAGKGGVGYEKLIITAEVVQSIDTKKFIPLIRNNNIDHKVPAFLGPRLYIDFNCDEMYTEKLDDLLRELLGSPAAVKTSSWGKSVFWWSTRD